MRGSPAGGYSMATISTFGASFSISGGSCSSSPSSTLVTLDNYCNYTVWPGIISWPGTSFPRTGFELPPGGNAVLRTFFKQWRGRIWARTHCSNTTGKFTCATGDCGTGGVSCNGRSAKPPATMIHIRTYHTSGYFASSLVDGFNVPVRVLVKRNLQGRKDFSKTTVCNGKINMACPPELRLNGARGEVIGCKSACSVFRTPEFCCTGNYSSKETCMPNQYSSFFKSQCPEAQTYRYDDYLDVNCCEKVYAIEFCPPH